MRHGLIAAALSGIMLASGTALSRQPTGRGGGRGNPIAPGELCPSGTRAIRPRLCRAPEFPAPSIVDYRPKSTLVTPVHLMPRARYPAIDFHGHPQGLLGSAEGITRLGASLDSLNVRMMVAADNMSGERLARAMSVINASPWASARSRKVSA